MYAQVANLLFTEREDHIWDSSNIFPGEPSMSQPLGVFTTTDYPLLLSNPNPMANKSLDDLSLTLNAPPPLPEVQPMSWRDAAAEAAEGVHYVKERFPSEHVTYLSPPFRKEPIQVEVNDKVILLDEVSDFAVRVRRVADGTVGVVPAWDIEDPLERLARMNMELNEIVTSPTSPGFRRTFTTLPTEHILQSAAPDTALPDATLSSPEMGSDDDLPVTPTSAGPAPRTLAGRKAEVRRVEFAAAPQKTVFRYLRPEHFDFDDGEDRWWDGWEEHEGGAEEAPPTEEARPERLGRPRLRRQDAFLA